MSIGVRIKTLRKRNGLTQKQLASKVNVSSQVISNWEREYTSPDYDDVARLAFALNTTSDFLLGKTENPNEEEYDYKKDPTIPDDVRELLDKLEAMPEDTRKKFIKRIHDLADLFGIEKD